MCFPYFQHRNAFLSSGIKVLSWLPASKCAPYFPHRSAFLISGIEMLSYLPASKCFPYFRHRSALLTSRIEVLSLLPTSKFFYSILVDDICSKFKALPKLGLSCLASLRALRTAFAINPFPGNILERCFKRISYLGLSWFPSTRLSYSFLYFLHNLPNSFFSSTLYFPKLITSFKLLSNIVLTSTILHFFILQLKPKQDYYNNNIRLLTTFKFGFNIFRIHVMKKVNETITISA